MLSKNNTWMRLVFVFILIAAFAVPTSVFAQGETDPADPPAWLKPMIEQCGKGLDSACNAVAAYYASQATSDKTGNDAGGGDLSKDLFKANVTAGEALDCSQATAPKKFLDNASMVGPFDWIKETRYGDEYPELMTLVEYTAPTHALAFMQGTYLVNFAVGANEHLLGQAMLFEDSPVNVMCAAQEYAKVNSIEMMIYAGDGSAPMGWINWDEAEMVDHMTRATDRPVQIHNEKWTDPAVNLEMGMHTIGAPTTYHNAQLHPGLDANNNGHPDVLWHIYTAPNCNVTPNIKLQGTDFEVGPDDPSLPLDLTEVLSRFTQMSETVVKADTPDSIHLLFFGPPDGTNLPTGWDMLEKLPAGWTGKCTTP